MNCYKALDFYLCRIGFYKYISVPVFFKQSKLGKGLYKKNQNSLDIVIYIYLLEIQYRSIGLTLYIIIIIDGP